MPGEAGQRRAPGYGRTGRASQLAAPHDALTVSPLGSRSSYGVFPGQAASTASREGFGFASRKFRHSPADSSARKKRLPPVALSRITIPCLELRVITTSPTHGSFRTSDEASIASLVVEEVDEVDG